jgi:hypothetical protein
MPRDGTTPHPWQIKHSALGPPVRRPLTASDAISCQRREKSPHQHAWGGQTRKDDQGCSALLYFLAPDNQAFSRPSIKQPALLAFINTGHPSLATLASSLSIRRRRLWTPSSIRNKDPQTPSPPLHPPLLLSFVLTVLWPSLLETFT